MQRAIRVRGREDRGCSLLSPRLMQDRLSLSCAVFGVAIKAINMPRRPPQNARHTTLCVDELANEMAGARANVRKRCSAIPSHNPIWISDSGLLDWRVTGGQWRRTSSWLCRSESNKGSTLHGSFTPLASPIPKRGWRCRQTLRVVTDHPSGLDQRQGFIFPRSNPRKTKDKLPTPGFATVQAMSDMVHAVPLAKFHGSQEKRRRCRPPSTLKTPDPEGFAQVMYITPSSPGPQTIPVQPRVRPLLTFQGATDSAIGPT